MVHGPLVPLLRAQSLACFFRLPPAIFLPPDSPSPHIMAIVLLSISEGPAQIDDAASFCPCGYKCPPSTLTPVKNETFSLGSSRSV